MDIEDVIQKVVDNGKVEDMHALSDILEETMEAMKKYDEDHYNKYSMELYKMAYGETLTKPMAEKIVRGMKPYGEKWRLDDIKPVQEKYGFTDLKTIDVYAVMNMAYNDYNDLFEEDVDKYVKFTIDFIDDEDAVDGKVFKYFTEIPRMEE